MTKSVRISGLVLSLAALAACANEEEEATENEEAVEELAGELSFMEAPGGGEAGPHGEMGPIPFLRCDPDPEIEWAAVCGRSIPVAAHFAWTTCESPMGASSGSIDITALADLDATECPPLSIERQVTFSVTRALQDDASATASGELVIATQLDAAGPSRVVNGEIGVALPDGDAIAVVVTDVERVPPPECRWPIAGTVARTAPDGTTRTLEFGPECGQASVDGEPIDLESSGGPPWN
jgi:hypothetical protein